MDKATMQKIKQNTPHIVGMIMIIIKAQEGRDPSPRSSKFTKKSELEDEARTIIYTPSIFRFKVTS
jgi:hypothetical protein